MAVKKLIDFQVLSKPENNFRSFPWQQNIALSSEGGLSSAVLEISFLEN